MSYLLKIKQYEKTYDIGVFETEELIYKFIESIPFVKKEVISNDYINYFMKFEEIPNEDEIYFNWNKIHLWDKKIATQKTFIEGETTVDAYSFSNDICIKC
ncbi:MAG: hypothetical protein RR324_00500 [Cellulosilyticaceae bacterium]